MSLFGINRAQNVDKDDEHIYYNLSIDNAYNGVSNETTRQWIRGKSAPRCLFLFAP